MRCLRFRSDVQRTIPRDFGAVRDKRATGLRREEVRGNRGGDRSGKPRAPEAFGLQMAKGLGRLIVVGASGATSEKPNRHRHHDKRKDHGPIIGVA